MEEIKKILYELENLNQKLENLEIETKSMRKELKEELEKLNKKVEFLDLKYATMKELIILRGVYSLNEGYNGEYIRKGFGLNDRKKFFVNNKYF